MQRKKNPNSPLGGGLAWALGLSLFLHGVLVLSILGFFHPAPTNLRHRVVMVDLGGGGGAGGDAPTAPVLGPEPTKPTVQRAQSTLKDKAQPESSGESLVEAGQGGGTGGGAGPGAGASVGAGHGPGNGGDGSLGPYVAKVLARIESRKHYPRMSRENGEEGEVLVELKIGRSGQLLDYGLLGEPPSPGLGRAGLRSIQAAAPFPPLPVRYAQDTLTLEVPVRFKLR